MRKLSAIPLVALMVLVLATALPVMADPVEKITICHAAGLDGTTHYETLTIGAPAVFGPGGHFNENGTPQAGHEQDYLGECETTNTTPTTSSTTTSEPTTTTETTAPSSTTSTPDPTTTTTLPSSTAPSTTAQSPTTTNSLLPFTGISDMGELTILAAALLAAGTVVVKLGRNREDRGS